MAYRCVVLDRNGKKSEKNTKSNCHLPKQPTALLKRLSETPEMNATKLLVRKGALALTASMGVTAITPQGKENNLNSYKQCVI